MQPSQSADLAALGELKARYFRFLDTKAWDDLRTVFTDDVVYEDDAKQLTLCGVDALMSFLTSRHAQSVSIHQGFMPELAINGDSATGIWSMEDIVRIPVDGALMVQHGYGHYHEEYVRTPAGWRIRRIHLTRLWLSVGTETLVGSDPLT